ncbi:MAG: ATP-binding cassette domain-containing protein, partial [Limnochordales bacterium]
MIQAIHVSKRYGPTTAVDDVTVTIKKNRITSLIGPNGAGKSTLLALMSRLAPMDQGDVLVEGRSVRSWDSMELARKVAILKQTNHLSLRLTVRDLVGFGRFPYSQGRLTKADMEHVDQAIEYMNLGDLQHKFLDELSGGERQRAFIAMVVAQDTEYVLLDEPLNNLDMK